MLRKVWDRLPKVRFGLLALSLLMVVSVEIAATCLIPEWRDTFYQVLQVKDQASFPTAIGLGLVLFLVLGLAQGLKTWVGQLTSFLIRTASSKLLFKTWVKGERQAKNYTQAMTESLRQATELYLEISVEIVISISIVISLLIVNMHNPLILISSLLYTAVASGIATLFNKPMITSNSEWQVAEGSYREALSDIYNDRGDFSSKYKWLSLTEAYYKYIKVTMYFVLFSRLKGSLSSMVPYIILASSFFSGAMTLGEFMGGVATFELIVVNATILMLLYPKLTQARASYRIIKNFYGELNDKSIQVSDKADIDYRY